MNKRQRKKRAKKIDSIFEQIAKNLEPANKALAAELLAPDPIIEWMEKNKKPEKKPFWRF